MLEGASILTKKSKISKRGEMVRKFPGNAARKSGDCWIFQKKQRTIETKIREISVEISRNLNLWSTLRFKLKTPYRWHNTVEIVRCLWLVAAHVNQATALCNVSVRISRHLRSTGGMGMKCKETRFMSSDDFCQNAVWNVTEDTSSFWLIFLSYW